MTQQRPPHDQLVFVNNALRTSLANLRETAESYREALAAHLDSRQIGTPAQNALAWELLDYLSRRQVNPRAVDRARELLAEVGLL
jgi:hypothetical protein